MRVRKRLEKLSEELLESFTALVCLWAAPNRVFTKVLVNQLDIYKQMRIT
jgi:hypothetical protein